MNIYRVILEYFDINEFTALLMELSSFDRIQGSQELLEAVKYVSDVLSNTEFKVNVLRYSYEHVEPYLSSLIGWSASKARAEIVKPKRITIVNYPLVPTNIAIHTPPGYFSGKVIYVEDPLRSDCRVDGAIVVTPALGMATYLYLVKAGAKAVIFFKRKCPSSAVPYISLFPSVRDLPFMKVPALTISKSTALRVIKWLRKGIDVVVEGYVESRYFRDASLPVLEVTISDFSPEYHITAHICHPRGLINDNSASVAALTEALIALNRAMKRKEHLNLINLINKLKYGLRVLFIPEHYGSYMYLRREVISKGRVVAGALNLDMISEKQQVTSSVLNIVRPLSILSAPFEAVIYRYLLRYALHYKHALGAKSKYLFNITPYEPGSDHDVYIALGIPSISVTHWPDKFHHTNLDTIDKTDLQLTARIATSALVSMIRLCVKSPDPSIVNPYMSMVLGTELLESNSVIRNVRTYVYYKYLREYLNVLGILGSSRPLLPPSIDIDKRDSIRGKPGFLTYSYIREVADHDTYLEMIKLSLKYKWIRKAVNVISALLAINDHTVDVKELVLVLMSELGRTINIDTVEKLLTLLRRIRFIN